VISALKKCKTLMVHETLVPKLKKDTFNLIPVIERKKSCRIAKRFKFNFSKNSWLSSNGLNETS